MKLFAKILKSTPAMLLALALFFAPMAYAADEAHAHGPETGEVGDHHPDSEQKEVLHFSGSLMFWEYLTFGIVVLVLGGFVFPKLLGQLNARQDGIKEALDKADQVKKDADQLLAKHEELMKNANIEAKKITDEAVAAGRDAAAKIRAEAENSANEIRSKAEAQIEQQRKKAEAELRDLAVELALTASSKVLERAVNEDDHRRLAKEAIDSAVTMRN